MNRGWVAKSVYMPIRSNLQRTEDVTLKNTCNWEEDGEVKRNNCVYYYLT